MKQVPLVFVSMSRRNAEDYEEVLRHHIKICEDSRTVKPEKPLFEFTEFVCDFEKAVWKAVRRVFPTVTIKGCGFHQRKAIFHKIQELGMATLYIGNVPTRKLCRMLMALNLQPKEKIEERFNNIKGRVVTISSSYICVTTLRKIG